MARRSVLNDELVIEARRLRREGWRITDLARKYGVSAPAMGCALSGESYAHVPDPIPVWSIGVGRKLSVESVVKARSLYQQGASIPKLAGSLGVTSCALRKAISGDTWPRVPGAVHAYPRRPRLSRTKSQFIAGGTRGGS
jgi:hypothetical protein